MSPIYYDGQNYHKLNNELGKNFSLSAISNLSYVFRESNQMYFDQVKYLICFYIIVKILKIAWIKHMPFQEFQDF